MRKIAALLILLIPLASAYVQTFESVGVNPDLLKTYTSSEIEIPYERTGDCTPFAIIIHNKGSITIFDGNVEMLSTTKTGTHRIILHNDEGVLRILLQRKEGESYAEISEKSIIGCEKIPVVEINVSAPAVWQVGGITWVTLHIKNNGTADANGYIILHPPTISAALKPPSRTNVPSGKTIEVRIPMITAEERNIAIFPSQCFTYSDGFGRWTECTKDFPITTVVRPSITCIIFGSKIEVFNTSYIETEINGTTLQPRDSEIIEYDGKEQPKFCETVVKADLHELKPKEDKSISSAIILLLFGILGMLLAQKRLKTPKA